MVKLAMERERLLCGVPIKFGPDFIRRLRYQNLFERGLNFDGVELLWAFTKGDYSGWSLLKQACLDAGSDRETPDLHGVEIYLKNLIKNLLKGADRPIVAVDVGGMLGLSWGRLAKYFEREVHESKAVFVVTNLSHITDTPLPKLEDVSRKEAHLFKNTKRAGLVHYICATPRQLQRTQLTLPDGRVIGLRGNVALLHDYCAVTMFSHSPEDEILRLASTLSKDGSYYSYNILPPNSYHELTYDNIQRLFGLTRVETVEEGPHAGTPLAYSVFRKPDAPKVVLKKDRF